MNAQRSLRGFSIDRSRNEPKTNGIESLASTNNIVNEIETIRTYRLGGARGPLIAKASYFTMADVILSFLLVNEEVSLVELVNHVENIKLEFKANTNWLLLQVKQDIEHKGFIERYLKAKSPHLKLRKKVFMKSEFKKTLAYWRSMDF
jgi:hypothetical protein